MTTMTSEDVTEVRRAKRSWPAQYKLDILTEIEAAKDSGAITVAEICRREGLYSSLILTWAISLVRDLTGGGGRRGLPACRRGSGAGRSGRWR